MALRVFTRLGLMKALALDDYLSIVAYVVYLARAITLYVGLRSASRLSDAYRVIIANWLMILLYAIGTWLIKLSFSVTLYRIVRSRVLTVAIIVLALATTIITVFEFFWTLFLCNPIEKLWKGPAVEGSCHPGTTWGISLLVHGGVLLVVDLALGIVVPVVVLRKLQMRTLLRVSVGVTIAVGSLASLATIARLFYTHRLFDDPAGSSEPLNIWMDVEIAVNIICTAAITLKPLLRKTGILTASLSSGYGTHNSIPMHLGHRGTATGPGGAGRGGGAGMRIQVEEEIAIWSEAQAEGVVVFEERERGSVYGKFYV
ncbi:hypothetical protein BJX68DRAFT_255521 [Aspergillus pseudodeflectus]|uniref:Rhodopsin domain-containing protein n=1 Tax=Aspergillus pseudodeflectus TaxID=176178 RepID=A0ABR4KB39_9EURO